MTTCFGLQADNTALIATISTDGTVTPIGTPSGTSTLGCAGSPASSSDPLQNGTPFSDPQGSLRDRGRSRLGPSARHDRRGSGIWLVAEPDDAFAPNVNVLTQAVPGMDLQGYLDLSVANAPMQMADFALVGRDVIEGTTDELGVMEYSGSHREFE
jgi:hypothetical protein